MLTPSQYITWLLVSTQQGADHKESQFYSWLSERGMLCAAWGTETDVVFLKSKTEKEINWGLTSWHVGSEFLV